MNVFNENSPWITEDNRRLRAVCRTTTESMNHKHAALLPPETLNGKTVLDLGCCIGATGFWALRHGAEHYTGVEVQEQYARKAVALLNSEGMSLRSSIHQSDLTCWLESKTRGSPHAADETYDVVVLAGVLYGFIDPLYVLRMASELARECVVVDMFYPPRQRAPDAAYMEIIPCQRMVVATHDDSIAAGAGSRFSPLALDLIMANYGFTAERMAVRPITDTHDAYNSVYMNRGGGHFPLRYITRYKRAQSRVKAVNESIAIGHIELVPHAQAPR